MEKKYQYRDTTTGKIVEDFMAEDYVLEELGLTVTPKGKSGEMTIKQLENIQETIEWFFSGESWIKEIVKEE